MKKTGTFNVWYLLFLFTVHCSLFTAAAQVNPPFDLSHSVIASGGSVSTGSAGGRTFRVDGTAGQNSAGTISTAPNGTGGQFSLRGGFWAFEPSAPTAAEVSISGRVLSANGRPISKTRVTLTGNGVVRTALSNSFGFYRLDGVEAGQTYIIEASGKHFLFEPQVVFVSDELIGFDLIALPTLP